MQLSFIFIQAREFIPKNVNGDRGGIKNIV